MPKPIHPFRVYLPNDYVITVRGTLRQVATEFPGAIRIERADVQQPPRIIENDNDE